MRVGWPRGAVYGMYIAARYRARIRTIGRAAAARRQLAIDWTTAVLEDIRHPGSLHHLQCLSQKVRLTASLLLPLCALMAAVRAAETETQCESASETDACQDAEGSDGLQEHCAAECAVVFLPWFDDAQGTCFTALHLD
eukprot:SAG31_NODE_14464_length_804_cov_4.890780_1_plen_138_part_10